MTPSIGMIYRPSWRTSFDGLALDLYNACSHNCSYCYVKWDRQEKLPVYRPDLIDRQLREMAIAPDAPQRVHFCHFCDPYGVSDSSLTRKTMETFKRYWNPWSILSKGGTKAIRDFDLYFNGCRFGQSLTCDNDVDSTTWEPGAALPADRIDALKQAHERGIETWVCLEPVIKPEQTLHLIELTHGFVDFYWVGKLNHYPEQEASIDWAKFLADAEDLLRSLDMKYGIKYQLKKAAIERRSHYQGRSK